MKERINRFVLGIFRKPDLSLTRGRFAALSGRMTFKNSLSLKSLIILGFVIAVIPLFLAVMYAAIGMRDTSALGRTINSQVFEQTKAVRLVLQKTGDIERKARLFILLSDPAVRQPYEQQSYDSARAAFKQALSVLLNLRLDNKIALWVNELSAKEDLIYQQIIASANGTRSALPLDQAFQGLRESSHGLSREFESHVDHQFIELRRLSEALEQGLLIKGAVLSAVSLIFIAILLAILSRSLRQLDGGIRRLGSGKLETPIAVEGPADMRYLGNRLEWLRAHLLELEASKQQFARNVAREIELPLASIRESAKQLVNEADGGQQDIARLLCRNVGTLKTVSEELLRYSRITAKPEPDRKEIVTMKDVLESVVEEFQPRLQAKSISVKMLAQPVEISGIHEQLRGIVEQLLANAVKYSPAGGEIRIMLRDSGSRMELEVEDEGPGIALEEREQVFEPFFRGKTAAFDESAEGPGLGLAIVRDYVANHQGRAEIIDPRQGQQGARVRVQLPLDEKA
jgi:two-component system sensor histidine kinase GlrK